MQGHGKGDEGRPVAEEVEERGVLDDGDLEGLGRAAEPVAVGERSIDRSVDLYASDNLGPGDMRFIVYSLEAPLVLSDALPILERMGAEVHTEHPYEARLQSGASFWIQDFHLCHESGNSIDVDAVSDRFEECFMAVLSGEAENDGLNRLIVSAGLNWREVALVRCYTKHILQLGLPFSQSYMEHVLVSHADLAHSLVRLFEAQFDPSLSRARRTRECNNLQRKVNRGVRRARNVDEDRILNAFAGGIAATLRSNYFLEEDGKPKSYISIKLDPSLVPEVPLPRCQAKRSFPSTSKSPSKSASKSGARSST